MARVTFHAECQPAKGLIRRIAIYTVEGEVGCRVSEQRADRHVRYRSTATPAEFIAQHKHLGPWEITGRSTGDSNGNPDEAGSPGEEVGAIEAAYRRSRDLYGQDILSGRGAYVQRLG